MLIEKVITNFSDVSLWAIALVVGYVLIGAILLLRLAWKRKHTKRRWVYVLSKSPGLI